MPMRCVPLLIALHALAACTPVATNEPPQRQSTPGSQGSREETAPPGAEDRQQPPPVPEPETGDGRDRVAVVDEAAIRHAEAEAAAALPLFETAAVLDGSSFGLVGDGVHDNTEAFGRLLTGGRRTVRVQVGDYLTDQLRFDPYTRLILEPGVIIRDAGRLSADQGLLSLDAHDVHIFGSGAGIIGAAERYTSPGLRHGIVIGAARNILIDGLEAVGHSGSGFLIAGSGASVPTEVVLRGCRGDNNGDGGLQVTSARRLRVIDCDFTNGKNITPGLSIRPAALAQSLEDLVVLRTYTRGNLGGGVVIDLQALEPASEPATVTIVEHLSALEPTTLLAQIPADVQATVRYSRAYESNPRQDWSMQRQLSGAIVLSYYWPVRRGEQDFYELSMSTPKAIDILAAESHGSAAVRSYWTRRGKMLLSRVYPFRTARSEQDLYAYFAESMRNAAGISIDEVIAHKLQPAQRLMLDRVLTGIRTQFPDKLIVVWDASQWDSQSEHLLRTIRNQADAIVLQTYISEAEARRAGFVRFVRQLAAVEAHAPGISSKTMLGIGAYADMRDSQNSNFAEHLEQQIRFISQVPELCAVAGVGIYAPVYLTLAEQKRLDTAISSILQTGTARPACTGASAE